MLNCEGNLELRNAPCLNHPKSPNATQQNQQYGEGRKVFPRERHELIYPKAWVRPSHPYLKKYPKHRFAHQQESSPNGPGRPLGQWYRTHIGQGSIPSTKK